ncbi:MAG: hypothetical protein A2268_01115 [Candidatus Raymondbacteria bacterium RifOxyA12_full_50_37]|uniref:Uncharacterized protein n=1 Tax=Candidatus Raymondbacteria bacterium RIFOXYD12_FULL_49_13 TaxID=1817890 RepID=A0A1F7FFY5_UNCRA|nr:MAG: hypothetical protein A2268_01115 [Candidatus Raymondbacteria bacterium RifOxyA12_full_50_37]OGJ86403.1 MAG: hypothetical protein A2248_14080 [Candidatus Raymondbacteria bacterium RIFOXYA2_FULL_49_16]OGJ95573.1 MAG: hypothetical protein A2453_12855 [Candidatus Raymondbacteria bacterium RIFOXYC2_FULL_50_21]OGK05533.1 MAG: hypothetical protein A2519_05440 [Candidatus Raymondbacteria bacterium RIFOXYD12_FULL_49_13]OGP39984.1 MAG: hypothetical protein A2324_11125 [Candidatus Raymondbacteria 
MKLYFFAVSMLIAASVLFSEETILNLSGTVDKIFIGKDAKITAVCQKIGNAKTAVSLFTKGSRLKNTIDVAGIIGFLDNDGFEKYLAFVELAAPASDGPQPDAKVFFVDVSTGEQVKSKLSVQPGSPGRWAGKGLQYYIYGKLCIISKTGVDIDRKSSIRNSEINKDLTWTSNPIVQPAEGGKIRVTIELEHLPNNDMINIESFVIPDDSVVLHCFTDDGNYLYYRSGPNPAIYDLKTRQSLAADNITYKLPKYFGYYLGDERCFFFHDYYSITVLDRDKFAIKEVVPNPFNPEHVRILGSDKKNIYGVLINEQNGKKDLTKLFKLNLINSETALVDLPLGTVRAWVAVGEGYYYYVDGKMLKYASCSIK